MTNDIPEVSMIRRFRTLLSIALIAVAVTAAHGADAKADSLTIYLGTYTGQKSKGIYVTHLNLSDGTLSKPDLAAELPSPSFLALHPSGKALYAISEIDNFADKKSGAVSAFSIDAATGHLTLLNQQPSGGPGPCFIA